MILASFLIIMATTHWDASLAMQENNLGAPSYAGFAEIDPNKNFFILVGDTQRTSHWEFWRERNDKERRLIIDEITKRAPAFVVHRRRRGWRTETQTHC